MIISLATAITFFTVGLVAVFFVLDAEVEGYNDGVHRQKMLCGDVAPDRENAENDGQDDRHD